MKAWIQRWRFLGGIGAVSAFSFLSVSIALAQDVSTNLDTVQQTSGLASTDLPTVIGTIIGVFLGTLGVVGLLILLYAGWLWMTAGGEAKQIDKAKDIMVRAVVGLVIILSAYAITTFIINMLKDAGLAGDGGLGAGGTVILSPEPHSGSLGNAIRDHYPARGATDVARNTRIFVTFRSGMDIPSFISGYDTKGTPEDTSDDVVTTTLNTDNVKIYKTADGESGALTADEVRVGFTSDLKTFTFDPPVLGSSTDDVNYTVVLSDRIQDTTGDTPIDTGGYEWVFTTGTNLDLTPPTITSVQPVAGRTYDRNILVQVTFSEAVDPTSSTGLTSDGFANIHVNASSGTSVDGSYTTSNQYRTITFTTTDECGTNSCGEKIYCLPASDSAISATVVSATAGASPPQVDVFPYDGVVDTAGNTFDGDAGTETTYEDYSWSFGTTNNVNLSAPEIESIAPSIEEENVTLDQDVVITFGCTESAHTSSCDSVLQSSTIDAGNINLLPSPTHELWYAFSSQNLTSDDQLITTTTQVPAKTQVTIDHGIFLESVPSGTTYGYQTAVGRGIRNEYQNCYSPGTGPDPSEGRCGTDALPYCCNGVAQATACTF